MVTATLPARNEVEEQYKWNMESVYPDTAKWESDFELVGERLPGLEAYKNKLAESGKLLYQALNMQDELSMLFDKVFTYAFHRQDEDTNNSTFKALYDRSISMYSQVMSAGSFITPEIVAIDDAKLESFFNEEPRLERYRFYLEQLRREREHVRSPEIEELLAQTIEVTQTPGNVYDILNDADFKFGSITDEDGNKVELTQGRYISFLDKQNRRVRQEAFETYYGVYKAYNNTLAGLYNASVKSDIFYARARRYKSSLQAALKPNNLPEEVYYNLVETVNRNLGTLHRYIRLRKKLLGVADLHFYDIYVPLVPDADRKISYSEALDTVIAALAPLGEDYVNSMVNGIKSRWIDVYETVGKRSGAYSGGGFLTPPFILLNHQDNLDSMFTLAHELGHSMHSFYTRKTQPYTYANYTTFVAEVASTTNEALLTDYLLKNTTDIGLRKYIINNELEKFRGTLHRQCIFAEFELQTHQKAEAGIPLTPDLLNDLYAELNKKYYGDAILHDEQIAYEWSRIPHFYRAFYVFQYSTGISAATALSQQIMTEGQPAVERYLNFLKGGSSDYSTNLLNKAGVDMTSPQPIQQALDYFETMLDKFEELMA
jgi:oligoendopeptidase F